MKAFARFMKGKEAAHTIEEVCVTLLKGCPLSTAVNNLQGNAIGMPSKTTPGTADPGPLIQRMAKAVYGKTQ